VVEQEVQERVTVDEFKEGLVEVYMKKARWSWSEAYEYVSQAYVEEDVLMLIDEHYTPEDAAYEDMAMWD
jgi:hypothetical protein